MCPNAPYFCSPSYHSDIFRPDPSTMQFLKSPILLVLALAAHASASALPAAPAPVCIPAGGLCSTILGPIGTCCTGTDCISAPGVTDTKYVGTILLCILGIMVFNSYGNSAARPRPQSESHDMRFKHHVCFVSCMLVGFRRVIELRFVLQGSS